MKIRFTLQAKAQLESAFEYIAAESPKAAATVMDRIEHSLSLIGDSPEMGRRGAEPGTRELPCLGLPTSSSTASRIRSRWSPYRTQDRGVDYR